LYFDNFYIFIAVLGKRHVFLGRIAVNPVLVLNFLENYLKYTLKPKS